eukprot:m.65038 g.65038  ORF g.65038 m.65038 type:complete len:127 (+) comp7551_c0_seq1:1160-1540(+)
MTTEPESTAADPLRGCPDDGGELLRRLWVLFSWREIRGCPGRFVVSRDADTTTPEELLAAIGADESVCASLQRVSSAGRDPIALVAFPGGGGLLTYIKANGNYVHTLNSESGRRRKLLALGLAHLL